MTRLARHDEIVERIRSAMLAQALRSAHRRGMKEAAGMVEAKTQEYRDEAHDQKQWGNRVAENGALVGARALKNMAAAIRAVIKNEEQPQEPTDAGQA